jgi:hypothetical protein
MHGQHAKADSAQGMFRRLTGFDYLVLTGGVINLIVVSIIIGYWLMN